LLRRYQFAIPDCSPFYYSSSIERFVSFGFYFVTIGMDESDTDSDDWAKEDLPDLPLSIVPLPSNAEQLHNSTAGDDEEEEDSGWEQKLRPTVNKNIVVAENDRVDVRNSTINPNDTGEPIIIVDMTTLSERLSLSEIHCRFDPNSVNDVVAVKALRQQIESHYDTYSKNMDYISERVVIPCGSSVYRPALVELRHERPGHFFYPIFPPKI
jgi:hypothetical protein